VIAAALGRGNEELPLPPPPPRLAGEDGCVCIKHTPLFFVATKVSNLPHPGLVFQNGAWRSRGPLSACFNPLCPFRYGARSTFLKPWPFQKPGTRDFPNSVGIFNPHGAGLTRVFWGEIILFCKGKMGSRGSLNLWWKPYNLIRVPRF